MILKRIEVKNFRSIRHANLEVGKQTTIVGGNGAGKSTVLRAVDRFYSPNVQIELDDFFGKSPNANIEIGLTFIDFSAEERAMFASRIHDEEMTVVRVFEPHGGRNNGRYFGAAKLHPAFSEIRAAGNANAARAAYNRIRELGGVYSTLPTVTRADQIPDALAEWEAAHSELCELALDDGQFFGFSNVARGMLQKATSFVLIPAVRDASADALDTRGAVISRLLELVVRNVIQQRGDIRDFQARISEEYRSLTDPEKLTELGGLAEELTGTLKAFYREAAVALSWQRAEDFTVPLPGADVQLDDDGFVGPVDRKGHGLQRAFILTLLQHLAKATLADSTRQSEAGDEAATTADGGGPPPMPDGPGTGAASPSGQRSGGAFAMPGLILAIEEPELYQHPTKQRHFAKVLTRISAGELPGVARQMQVLFATHSSLFVSMDRFDEVRLARRTQSEGVPHKECRLSRATLSSVARHLEIAHGKPEGAYTADGLRARLHIVGAELAEGFFADAVVLVEGASDRAAVLAAAELENMDFEAAGIAVLPADGKTKLDRALAIFTSFGIPTYVIWDCDKEGEAVDQVQQNRALQRLVGIVEAEIFDAATKVEKNFACFESNLEKVLKSEIGPENYQRLLDGVKEKYGIERNDDAEKAPFAMHEMLTAAAREERRSGILSNIVKCIATIRDEGEKNVQRPVQAGGNQA